MRLITDLPSQNKLRASRILAQRDIVTRVGRLFNPEVGGVARLMEYVDRLYPYTLDEQCVRRLTMGVHEYFVLPPS